MESHRADQEARVLAENEIPDLGTVTFIDPREVEPILIRGMPTWGYVWIKAGFSFVGKTEGSISNSSE